MQSIKGSFKKICQDPFCVWGITLCLLFLAFGAIFLALFWSRLPPQVPLFYSRPWGKEQLADKNQILFLPIFAFLIFLFNFFSSVRLYPKEVLLARVLLGIGVILVFIFTLALFQIVSLVT